MAADQLRDEDDSRPPATGTDQAEPLVPRESRRSSNVRLLPATGAGTAQSAESTPGRPRPATKPSPPALSGRKAKAGRAGKPADPPRFRSLDMTGNVRMLTDQDIADLAADALERGEAGPVRSKPAASPAPGTRAPDSDPTWADAAPSWSSWSTSESSTDAAGKSRSAAAPRSAAVPWSAASPAVELPIAGYDELTLPSLRARLRQLNVGQLAILLSYERSHANRADIATLFERRIAKLSELGE